MPPATPAQRMIELQLEIEMLVQPLLSDELWEGMLSIPLHRKLLERALEHDYLTGGPERIQALIEVHAERRMQLILLLSDMRAQLHKQGNGSRKTPPRAASSRLKKDLRAGETIYRAVLLGLKTKPIRRYADGRIPPVEGQEELIRALLPVAWGVSRFNNSMTTTQSLVMAFGAQPVLTELLPWLHGVTLPFQEALLADLHSNSHQDRQEFWSLYSAYHGYVQPEERDELLFRKEIQRSTNLRDQMSLSRARLASHQKGENPAMLSQFDGEWNGNGYRLRPVESLLSALDRWPHSALTEELTGLPVRTLRVIADTPGETVQGNLNRLASRSVPLQQALERARRTRMPAQSGVS